MTRRLLRTWLLAWLGAAVLGVLNGVVRDTTYGKTVGEERAHQVSTGTLLLALLAYMWGLHRRWPLADDRSALAIGGAWTSLTLLFEFGLGSARGMSWKQMTADYDIGRGRTWSAIPLAMLVGPALVRRLQR